MENALSGPVQYYSYYVSEHKNYTAKEAYFKTVRRFHDAIFKNYSFPKVRKRLFDKYLTSHKHKKLHFRGQRSTSSSSSQQVAAPTRWSSRRRRGKMAPSPTRLTTARKRSLRMATGASSSSRNRTTWRWWPSTPRSSLPTTRWHSSWWTRCSARASPYAPKRTRGTATRTTTCPS